MDIIKEIKFLFKKKLFKEMKMEIHMTDGSIVMTDPISYKKFTQLVDQRINGEELRIANDDDYLIVYNEIKDLMKTPTKSDYFSVSIKGKTAELTSKEIVKIIEHKKG